MTIDDKDVLILKELLALKGDFVSGNTLAERLDVSRVSVWSHMEKLRAQGFEFEAVRSKGYRLTQKPASLNQTMITALLPRPAQQLRVIALDTIDSTNSEAERQLADAQKTPFVVCSRTQSAGRGRMGRVWHSPENGNLYMSFAFRPQISPAKLSTFTLWIGINLCECVNNLCNVDSLVKWPNDLIVKGKKVAGILTEARMDADQTRDIVLGIGLNVNSPASGWPAELSSIATSLSQEAGREFDINRVAATLAGRILQAYDQFIEGSHWTTLKEKWDHFDVLRGKQVSLLQGDARISGTATGIDPHGALILEREDGTHFQVRAGEVTIEKQ